MDLYDRERRLKSAERIVSDSNKLTEHDKGLILKFEDYLFMQGNGSMRITKCLVVLRIAGEDMSPLVECSKDKLEQYLLKIARNTRSSWSKRDYFIILKKFYKWLGKPELVENVRPPRGRSKVPTLLSVDEVNLIVRRTPHVRDKAMISGFYDLGGRVAEWFADLRIRNFIFEDHIFEEPVEIQPELYRMKKVLRKECFVSISGKTGTRTVKLNGSTGFIDEWIGAHPGKTNPNSYMWVNDKGKPLFKDYAQIVRYVRRIIKKAGIEKQIVLYSFRHSRMTELDTAMRETYMKQRHGTHQLETYIHNELR